MKRFKKQISNSLIYTISTIIAKAIPFLLLPVFTSYLSKEDYGMLGLISSILAIASIYIGLRPSLFLIVKGSQFDKNTISIYIYNIFILSSISLVFVGIILIISKYLFFPDISLYIFVLIAFLAFFSIFNEIVETIFQIEKKAFYYGIYQLGKTILSVGLALIFIIVFDMNWEGKYFSDLIVIFLFSIISIYYLYKTGYIKIKYDLIKQMELIKYLSPLTFHVLGLAMMASIDRVFLTNMLGLEATGLYTVAYSIGIIIGIVHDSLLKVWSPEFYKRIKNADIYMRIKLLKFNYLYMFGSVVLYMIFILVAPFIFSLMIDSKFSESYHIVPIVALGLTFESFRKLFISYFYNLGKNNLIAITTLTAGMLNAILNYILIPQYGLDGAAYATLIAYIIVFLLTIINLNRIENIPWRLS